MTDDAETSAQRLGVPYFEAVSVGHGRSSFAEQLAEKAVVISGSRYREDGIVLSGTDRER
jgi:hypothetical protein